MKRYFVCADVHGFYNELIDSLNKCGFDTDNKDHIFVSCGDLLDRGRQPMECLKFVNSIPEDRKILIRGNHEDLLQDAILRRCFFWNDYHNGTVTTCADLLGETNISESIAQNEMLLKIPFVKELENYYDCLKDYAVIGDFIFVHGWLPLTETEKFVKRNLKSANKSEWDKARWLNGMECWRFGVKPKDKTVVCGHWHASFGNYLYHNKGSGEFNEDADFSPFIDDGIIALDACTVHTGFVNCAVIEDNKLVMVNGEDL